MIILIFFAFLAGIATIIAPCILPLLPLVFSAGLTGGRLRPLGIIVGLSGGLSVVSLGVTFLTAHLGITSHALRSVAIIVLLAFGLTMLFPQLIARLEGWLSRMLPQSSPEPQGSGFWSGVVVGVSLGVIWTPCAGPILATVIVLAATGGVTLTSVFITLAYALGVGVPLLFLTYGGQRALQRLPALRAVAPRLHTFFALVMIATALSMVFGLDQKLQATLLQCAPSFSAKVTVLLESNPKVLEQLHLLNQPKPLSSPYL